MITEFQRQKAAETMQRNWQDPEFRAKMDKLNAERTHPTGEASPSWRGGMYQDHSGYLYIRDSAVGKYIRHSHYVWNQAYPNDPIMPGETIHHINHIRDDDRPENLAKLTGGTHSSLHHKGRVWSPEHRAKAMANAKKNHRVATNRPSPVFPVRSCGKAHSGCRICAPERYGPSWKEHVTKAQQSRSRIFTEETRRKLSAAVRRNLTPEYRQELSESAVAGWEKRRQNAK